MICERWVALNAGSNQLADVDSSGVHELVVGFGATSLETPTMTWSAVLHVGATSFVTPELPPSLDRWQLPASGIANVAFLGVEAPAVSWDPFRLGGEVRLRVGAQIRVTRW